MKKILSILTYALLVFSITGRAQTIDLYTPNGTVVKGFYRAELTPSEITSSTQQPFLMQRFLQMRRKPIIAILMLLILVRVVVTKCYQGRWIC